MHRAPASAPSALLMATATAALLVARVHSHPSSAIEALNPWLSACDLVQPGITDDLQGICSATTQATMPLPLTQGPGPPKQPAQKCPPQCRHSSSSITTTTHNNYNNYDNNNNNNNNTTSNQCLLYLEESHKEKVCGGDVLVEDRRRQVSSLRLRHCCEHAVLTVLRPRDRHAVLAGGDQCKHHLDALLEIDALAARISCEFTEVLTRYDCGQTYSIVYHCDDCKEAYRRWVCSSLVPHLTKDGGRVRPCRSICQTVEQRCPYMLPGDRAPAYPTQYAGEPTFLCLDPNIPETGKQKERSSHGDEDCCYAYCGTPGRPPCITCPRGPSNATWEPAQCLPPVPPKPPSGPTGCRGGLLTAPIPATAVATSSAPPSPTSSSTSTWPWTWRRQRRRHKKYLKKINHYINTLISGAKQNGEDDGIKQNQIHKYYENEYEYEYDYEYELNELWTTSTSRLLIVVVVAFTLLMLNDAVTTTTVAILFTLPIELILILKLILLIPTTLLLKLKCVQRARTWIQKNTNINIKTNNHWTISQHTHTHKHKHPQNLTLNLHQNQNQNQNQNQYQNQYQYQNQNTPDTTS